MHILLVLAGSLTLSFGAAIGVNIQKLSMNREQQKLKLHHRQSSPSAQAAAKSKLKKPRPPYLQPLWCLGMSIIIIDAIGDFVFIGLAPQSLLAPLGSLSLGWNIILAPIFNPMEKVTKQIVFATFIIYVGTLLTVLHATTSTPTYKLHDIVGFIQNRMFLGYFMSCILFQCFLVAHGKFRFGLWRGSISSSRGGDTTDSSKNSNNKGYGIIHYCGLAGCFGGQSVLFAKSSSELIKYALTTKNYNDWTSSPLPYIFLLCMVVSLLTQVTYLNNGLAKFDALVIVPVYQTFFRVFNITGGLVFFQEYQYMSLYDGFWYSSGIGITLIGIKLLTSGRAHGSSLSSSSQKIQEDEECLPLHQIHHVD